MKQLYPFLFACLLFALACGGCVRSEQPLSSIDEAKADPRLVGQWRGTEEDKENKDKSLRVTFTEKGIGHLSFLKENGKWEDDPNLPGFFITRTANAAYLNVLMYDKDQKLPDPTKSAHFMFFKYELSNDGRTMTYRGLKPRPFQEAVKAGKIKGAPPPGKGFGDDQDIFVTDASATILSFVEALPGDAYEKPVEVSKVR